MFMKYIVSLLICRSVYFAAKYIVLNWSDMPSYFIIFLRTIPKSLMALSTGTIRNLSWSYLIFLMTSGLLSTSDERNIFGNCFNIFLNSRMMISFQWWKMVHLLLAWRANLIHDDVIKYKHFPRYWFFVCGEFTGELPTQRPVTRSFDVFFDLSLHVRLSKQSYGWWFETPSCSLWRHCNG